MKNFKLKYSGKITACLLVILMVLSFLPSAKVKAVTPTTTQAAPPVTAPAPAPAPIPTALPAGVEIIDLKPKYNGYAQPVLQAKYTAVDPANPINYTFEYYDEDNKKLTAPLATVVGSYSFIVKVLQNGVVVSENTYTGNIIEGTIDGPTLTGVNFKTDGLTKSPLVSLDKPIPTNFNSRWVVTKNGSDSSVDPTQEINSAGHYTIKLIINDPTVYGYNPNYQTFTSNEVNSVIIGELIGGYYVNPASGLKYDGQPKELVTVTDMTLDKRLTIKYKVYSASDTEKKNVLATTNKMTAAGSYLVEIEISDPDTPSSTIEAVKVDISPKDQSITFVDPKLQSITSDQVSYSMTGNTPISINITATVDPASSVPTYEVKAVNGLNNRATDDTLNQINVELVTDPNDSKKKTLNLKAPGFFRVTVTAPATADNNYSETKKVIYITVDDKSNLWFEKMDKEGRFQHMIPNVPYEYIATGRLNSVYDDGQKQFKDIIFYGSDYTDYEYKDDYSINDVIRANNNRKDRSTITLTLDFAKPVAGASIDDTGIKMNSSGTLYIDNLDMLSAFVKAHGTVELKITATKPSYGKYDAATAVQLVNVKFIDTNTITLKPDQNPNGANGWYVLANPQIPTVTAPAGYKIAQNPYDIYDSSVILTREGIKQNYVYLKDAKGCISTKIPININLDLTPVKTTDMTLTFSNEKSFDDIIDYIFYGKQNGVVVTMTAVSDDFRTGAAVDHFELTYLKENGTSAVNKDMITVTIPAVIKDGVASAEWKHPDGTNIEELRGNISIVAVDKAGNRSDVLRGDKIVVYDTKNPTSSMTLPNPVSEIAGKKYYSSDLDGVITINEANFIERDVKFTVKKDGSEVQVPYTWDVSPTNPDEHLLKYTLSGDGDYVLDVTYVDRSGNTMNPFHYETITIDTVKPVLELIQQPIVVKGVTTVQKTTFTITEHNFDPSRIVLTGSKTDITGKALDLNLAELTNILKTATWSKNGDTYTFSYDGYLDGIYTINFSYTDQAGNVGNTASDNFTIDRSAPVNTKIEIITKPINTLLEKVTFGFYNPTVTIRFTANDYYSGVREFTWNYTQTEGSSPINRPTDAMPTVIPAVQDATDKSKFTAEITLPEKDAKYLQMNGYFSVIATDEYGNASDKIKDDGNIVVVDTIAPEVNVEYAQPTRVIDKVSYYNAPTSATVTVNEANFYADDIKVMVSKNGAAPVRVSPEWLNQGTDIHTAVIPMSEDADYIISIEYTDKSGNMAASYKSDQKTVDTIKPVSTVVYENTDKKNTLTDIEGNMRDYFNSTQTARVTITEHNFNGDEVNYQIVAKDVAGNIINLDPLISKSAWTTDGDNHTMIITYPGDANYTFDVDYTDLATNKMDDYNPDYFTVDTTPPTNLRIEYSTPVLEQVMDAISFGFYNAKATVTIHAEDNISQINKFTYSYINAAGVSGVNAELLNQIIEAAQISYSNGNSVATATFEIPKYMLDAASQFNGTVEFKAEDRATNESQFLKDTKRIVVDNISPTSQITYNDATNIVGDKSYFDKPIVATLVINEANFNAEDVKVTVTKDGNVIEIVPSWSDTSVDSHVGSFELSGDGDYTVSISYQDKSGNTMESYQSNTMTVDTEIKNPVITLNGVEKTGDGGAYKLKLDALFSMEDRNISGKYYKLIRKKFDKVEDVTEEFIKYLDVSQGGTGTFTIPDAVENDGVYELVVKMTDYANHSSESKVNFSVNRYGSVFVYDDYLASLIKDGGQYIKKADENLDAINRNLIITEYNADRLLEGSTKVLITRDGQTVTPVFDTNPVATQTTPAGENGWYRYVHTLKSDNFKLDGEYKISLSSMYNSSDSQKNTSSAVPENSIHTDGTRVVDSMRFVVDTIAPEIRNIVNLEEAIINAQNVDVNYNIVDVGGLRNIEIFVDGNPVQTVDEFNADSFNYSGTFRINESNKMQNVQIKAKDLAGNIIDTGTPQFSDKGLYIFNKSVLVSTNFFVRWFANKPLFWGSMALIVAILGLIFFLLFKKRDKDEEEKKKIAAEAAKNSRR